MVEDPLGLFPEGDQFFAGDSLAEPAVGLIPLQDLPSGVSLAEPAQAAPEAQHVEQPDQAQPASEALPASSGGRGRRPAVSSPLHILLPEDALVAWVLSSPTPPWAQHKRTLSALLVFETSTYYSRTCTAIVLCFLLLSSSKFMPL